MLKQNSSPNVNRVVRLSQIRIGETTGAVRSDDRRSGPLKAARAAWPDLPEYTSHPVVPVAEADRAISWWWTALAFFVGRLCDLRRIAASDRRVSRSDSADVRKLASSAWPVTSSPQHMSMAARSHWKTVTDGLERAAWADARPLRHWSWLGSLAEMIVTLWTYWRREREIRRVVAALAEYDDRTLRDLGICGRSDIERV